MEKIENTDGEELTPAFLGGEASYVHMTAGANQEVEAESDPLPHLLREQDRFLPIANVARIMKRCIPKTGKVAKDARECVQECVSEFISFVTSEASDRCYQEKRKTINGEDILWAMNNLGFESYVDPLKIYLQKYRETMKGDKPLDALHMANYDNELCGNIAFDTDGVEQQEGICHYAPGQVTQAFLT